MTGWKATSYLNNTRCNMTSEATLTRIERLEAEISANIKKMEPFNIHCLEGGGPEDLLGSLALTVANVMSEVNRLSRATSDSIAALRPYVRTGQDSSSAGTLAASVAYVMSFLRKAADNFGALIMSYPSGAVDLSDLPTAVARVVARNNELGDEVRDLKKQLFAAKSVRREPSENVVLRGRIERFEQEIEASIKKMEPFALRSCEGGGPEDLLGSLALTVSSVMVELRDIGVSLAGASELLPGWAGGRWVAAGVRGLVAECSILKKRLATGSEHNGLAAKNKALEDDVVLRDSFALEAMKVLVGVVAARAAIDPLAIVSPELVSAKAYDIADKMLKARAGAT